MKTVIQRIFSAEVKINNSLHSHANCGLLILLGIQTDDSIDDINYLVKKISNLRIFDDENGVMNLSAIDTCADIMIVSQFTLLADVKKGNRPSYLNVAKSEISKPLYLKFVEEFRNRTNLNVSTGVFGENMEIHLVNNGPVTICMDSKQ